MKVEIIITEADPFNISEIDGGRLRSDNRWKVRYAIKFSDDMPYLEGEFYHYSEALSIENVVADVKMMWSYNIEKLLSERIPNNPMTK